MDAGREWRGGARRPGGARLRFVGGRRRARGQVALLHCLANGSGRLVLRPPRINTRHARGPRCWGRDAGDFGVAWPWLPARGSRGGRGSWLREGSASGGEEGGGVLGCYATGPGRRMAIARIISSSRFRARPGNASLGGGDARARVGTRGGRLRGLGAPRVSARQRVRMDDRSGSRRWAGAPGPSSRSGDRFLFSKRAVVRSRVSTSGEKHTSR